MGLIAELIVCVHELTAQELEDWVPSLQFLSQLKFRVFLQMKQHLEVLSLNLIQGMRPFRKWANEHFIKVGKGCWGFVSQMNQNIFDKDHGNFLANG